jgi:hypothetical protein
MCSPRAAELVLTIERAAVRGSGAHARSSHGGSGGLGGPRAEPPGSRQSRAEEEDKM